LFLLVRLLLFFALFAENDDYHIYKKRISSFPPVSTNRFHYPLAGISFTFFGCIEILEDKFGSFPR